MLEWLLTSIDPDRIHQVEFAISWHGRFMTMAWGVLTPLAIIIARFFKVLPTQQWPEELDNQAWWHSHRICQYTAVVLMAVGTILILYRSTILVETEFHIRVGWVVIGLAVIQILSGIYRGSKGGPTDPNADDSLAGDHYDMTPYRVIFERYHKLMGYILMLSATYCIITGMWIANAPNWMWIAIGLWWVLLICVAVFLQLKGACFDTYQAIWGSDPELPGNQRKPIGFGIKTGQPWNGKKPTNNQ